MITGKEHSKESKNLTKREGPSSKGPQDTTRAYQSITKSRSEIEKQAEGLWSMTVKLFCNYELGWDLAPFPGVLAPEQMSSQAAEYKEIIRD